MIDHFSTRVVEHFDELEHYPLLQVWWKERGYPTTPVEMLPRVGFVVSSLTVPVCAGFLYQTDSPGAQIAHLVSDPRQPRAEKNLALDMLLGILEAEARRLGFKCVTGATNLPGLLERYKRLGFTCYDQGVTCVAKNL